MTCNMGGADRIFRAIFGLVVLGAVSLLAARGCRQAPAPSALEGLTQSRAPSLLALQGPGTGRVPGVAGALLAVRLDVVSVTGTGRASTANA